VRGPAMSLVGPARVQVLRVLWALMVVLWTPWRLWAVQEIQDCTWEVVLNEFDRIGANGVSDRFFVQEPVDTVDQVIQMLVDSPIDQLEKYLGFPYYLKINYSCKGQPSEDLVRKGYLTGLKPLVLVTFQSPVNFYRWKIEQLQIQMEGAPFRSKAEPCVAEELCVMNWYTPMPIKNGSVVMKVHIHSNGLGPFIPEKRFQMNINGFLKRKRYNTIEFLVGDEISDVSPRAFVNVPSRPLWYTVDVSPVLILGGIPNEKRVLMTDTSFKDFSVVELSIDSCWVGSFYCPHSGFSATIYDAIATEATLFIRQNQLVYYFTGTYPILHESNRGSGSWVRVLASECIKKLCPVYFHSNGTEYVLALTTGKNEGYLHFGTIRDGSVSFEMLPRERSVCEHIGVDSCSITWAEYLADDYYLLLLVESKHNTAGTYFQVVGYSTKNNDALTQLYRIPEFIPDARGLEFLMILGTESYTSTPMIPKGMFFNPYNNLLFIWGNFLLQSSNKKNYIYLADFPMELSIKYLVRSFHGDMAIVTETEEIWYLLEGSYKVYKLFPSKGWGIHTSLQAMHQSSFYSHNETMVTLFYEDNELYQLAYLINNQEGKLVKRLLPVEKLLMYQIHSQYDMERQGSHLTLSFTNPCPFTAMHLQRLPGPQRYTRQERYRARPPQVLYATGFHTENSLAVYQGLVYYLLWLHSKYDKPYADPVHDPTWRWWKNKKQDQDYYFYLASNWRSAGSVHIDMDSYEKIYNLEPESRLPERIFLDKGTQYGFSIFLTARGYSFQTRAVLGAANQLQSKVDVSVVLADPHCMEAVVKQEVLVNRQSVLFSITLKDKKVCYEQGISGHHLMKSSMMITVLGSSGHCFQNTQEGASMQGNLMVPVFIGCPPSKRLAFDITYTLKYNRLQNKHYFDCLQTDAEMPCFLFRDTFYPFFLIQDLVTGDSGSFQGSFVLKVVGGGPTLGSIRDYTEEEIYRFNSPLDRTHSLIWTTSSKITTRDLAFHIMSHQSSGIKWLCEENSPCYDTIPKSIVAPDYFFKVLVSNRGVDNSTYCNYKLIFLLHIHGLPLSAERAFFIVMVSASIFLGLVILYIIICLLWPVMVRSCNMLRWKINNIIASDSYYTYGSSRVSSLQSQGSKHNSKDLEKKDEPKETGSAESST
uniref:Cation channel sperm associated auxiliary subunit gamma n=1 Tax=Otolemur garnettii TaxID=30611 RepID=H0WP32_OTOGA